MDVTLAHGLSKPDSLQEKLGCIYQFCTDNKHWITIFRIWI